VSCEVFVKVKTADETNSEVCGEESSDDGYDDDDDVVDEVNGAKKKQAIMLEILEDKKRVRSEAVNKYHEAKRACFEQDEEQEEEPTQQLDAVEYDDPL
jgi:hypothetical protein